MIFAVFCIQLVPEPRAEMAANHMPGAAACAAVFGDQCCEYSVCSGIPDVIPPFFEPLLYASGENHSHTHLKMCNSFNF